MCTPQRIDAHTALVRAWYHNAANFPAQSEYFMRHRGEKPAAGHDRNVLKKNNLTI
jgi:hypothetical protein